MRERFLYLNGEIRDATQACISPYDIGLLRGYAVFDLLRTAGGRPFMLGEHLDRLRSSAADIGLRVPESDERIAEAIDRLLELNARGEATVRIVVTGGVSPDGMHCDPATPTLLIMTHDLPVLPREVYEKGARLLTHEHVRECPNAKSTNYLTLLKHQDLVASAGALDLLYHSGGTISEAATASFYLVRAGRIRAPREGVLPGTVGALVLGLSGDGTVDYGPFTTSDVFAADEAFLTSTTRGVVPIVEVDGRPIADGAVGPVTSALMRCYLDALERAQTL
jgi:branched-subunit amino acid aminotransferase/4-amino-4-deoxychorismate lyase